jgi:hypothetical protein
MTPLFSDTHHRGAHRSHENRLRTKHHTVRETGATPVVVWDKSQSLKGTGFDTKDLQGAKALLEELT